MYVMYHDLWSVLWQAAIAARRSDLVAVWKEIGAYRLSVQAKISPEAIEAIKTSEAILIIVQGKPTRINLDPGGLATWHQVVRDVNSNMN